MKKDGDTSVMIIRNRCLYSVEIDESDRGFQLRQRRDTGLIGLALTVPWQK